jgi:hypothetical protein
MWLLISVENPTLAQVVECPPSKSEALSSKPSIIKKKTLKFFKTHLYSLRGGFFLILDFDNILCTAKTASSVLNDQWFKERTYS